MFVFTSQFRSQGLFSVLLLTVTASLGCGEKLDTWRPDSVSSLDVSVATFPLGELSDVSLASLDGLGTLLGSESGLYSVGPEGLALVSDIPVRALTEFDQSILVATSTQLFAWTGELAGLYLDEALDGATFYDLRGSANELWIATSQGLYWSHDGELESFSELDDVDTVHTYQGSHRVVLERHREGLYLLERQGIDWVGQSLAQEEVELAMPILDGVVLGLREGELVRRRAWEENDVVWQPVALGDNDQPAVVSSLMVDPVSGASWTMGPEGLRRLLGAQVHRVTLTGGGQVLLDVTADGAVWLQDELSLLKLRPPRETVRYTEDIVPFHTQNCARCHSTSSTARPLDTYEAWVADIELIITAVGNGSMPADSTPLVGGGVEMLEAWKQGGLLQ